MIMRAALLAALMAANAGAAAAPAATAHQQIRATIGKWIADFNRNDMKSFTAACATRAAVTDGFPPYAWQTCSDWMRDYQANNKALAASHGRLAVGRLAYSEIKGDRAYYIYAATFSDTQAGKPVVYKGSWTMTLQKIGNRWLFTGSGSAWDNNDL
jgi:ketosteroid isomerase-like protein